MFTEYVEKGNQPFDKYNRITFWLRDLQYDSKDINDRSIRFVLVLIKLLILLFYVIMVLVVYPYPSVLGFVVIIYRLF